MGNSPRKPMSPHLSFLPLPSTTQHRQQRSMTTTKFDTPRDRRLLGVDRQAKREQEYEEANRETRRQRSKEYQRRYAVFFLLSVLSDLFLDGAPDRKSCLWLSRQQHAKKLQHTRQPTARGTAGHCSWRSAGVAMRTFIFYHG